MQIDSSILKDFFSRSYIPQASRAFGNQGAVAIRRLLDEIHLIYQHFDVTSVRSSLIIMISVNQKESELTINKLDEPQICSTVEEVGKILSINNEDSPMFVEIGRGDSYQLAKWNTTLDVKELSKSAIVYRFENHEERIFSGEEESLIQKFHPSFASNFMDLTQDTLEDALNYYGENWAKYSRCHALEKIWEKGVNGPRLILNNKPEALMRDSLCQAIGMMIRDANVRKEHNTDGTKPVDIVVNWFGSRHQAIIEVKWLGWSLAQSRTNSGKPTHTKYRNSRAQEGARQLADYLDREIRHTSATKLLGYLVIFDARRKNLKRTTTALTRKDAFHFENKKIVYSPDYSSKMESFRPPVRFFLRPRESSCI